MPNSANGYTARERSCPRCGALTGHTLGCSLVIGEIPAATVVQEEVMVPAIPTLGEEPVPIVRNDRSKIMEALAELARRDAEAAANPPGA
jgi:hypothetical protein